MFSLQLAVFCGLLAGLLFGSFLNVCITRVPRGESVAWPGSHCLSCGKPIRWYDNVPLVSWLALRGRCRDCGEAISWQYPAVEVAVGLWFAWLGFQLWDIFQPLPYQTAPVSTLIIWILAQAILGWLLIGLIVIDWQTQRLPDVFTFTGIAAGMFLVCVQAIFLGPQEGQIVLNATHQLRLSSPGSFTSRGNVFLTGPENLIWGRLLAVCGAALILLLVRWAYRALRQRDGLGLGDVKMLAMVAAFLGFWPAVLTLFFGALLASIYGINLIVRGRAGALTKLPLGSFLGIAGLVVAVLGNSVIAWYSSLL